MRWYRGIVVAVTNSKDEEVMWYGTNISFVFTYIYFHHYYFTNNRICITDIDYHNT